MVEERLVDEKPRRTFLIEREKILNDRPITPVSNDPKDLKAMTPNHILLLRRNVSSSLDIFDELDRYSARWKHVHLLANEFRQRWTKEYLPALQERQEWLERKSNFKVGDIVLLADKNLSRGQWPKRLVEQTCPDSERMVRQVVVRTTDGVYRGDLRKLCLLEEQLVGGLEQRPKPL